MASVTPDASAGTLDSAKDIGTKPADIVRYWLAQDKLAEKELEQWRKRGRKVVKRYRDERPSQQIKAGARFNVLWANVQVLRPVLYARTPKPDIAPRWIDTSEAVVRLAATILERSLDYISDRHDIDSVLRSVVEDRLLPGAGFARIRYEPTFGDEVEDPDNVGETYRPVESETTRWTYEYWEDVAWGPCRRFEEMPWVRFRHYMTRDEMVTRFGSVIGKAVPLDYTPKGMDKEGEALPPDLFKKATVLEFWDKTKRKVCWVAKEYADKPLDEIDDPLQLDGFWPMPKPLLSTTTNDKMVPVPDFAQYQDQADQLDILANRIDKLTRALRVAGAYAASEKATLQQLLNDDTDNRLIPVEDWAMFAGQKGGLEGAIVWLPIKVIAEVLGQLTQQFEKELEKLYQVSGLSDIMRGATEATETATAQRIKSQYGSIRVQDSQKDVARFARDLFRLAGQVISKHLDPETISEITGLPELPQPVAQPVPPPMPNPIFPIGMGAGPAPGMPPAPPGAAPPAPGMAQQPSPAAGAPQAPIPAQANGQGAHASGPPIPAPPTDPMAKYQQDLAAYQAYQREVQQKQAEFAAACQLLREDALRTFRLDIEADSTIAPDEEAEKESRVEFVKALGTLLEQSVTFVQQMPQAGGALIAEVLKFVAHGFRAGRPLEETIDKFADYLDKLPPPQPHTDPAIVKAQIEASTDLKRMQADQATDAAELQAENAREAARIQGENQREAARIAGENQREVMRVGADHAMHREEIATEMAKTHLVEGGKREQAAAKAQTAKVPASEGGGSVVHLHMPPPKPKRFKIHRDADGNMTGVEELADAAQPAAGAR